MKPDVTPLSFEFATPDEASASFCREVVAELCALGCSVGEAVERLDALWRGLDFVDDDLRYHDEPDVWAGHAFYGADTYWWTAPEGLKPIPWVTAARLTALLTRSGALSAGAVAAVEKSPVELTQISRFEPIAARYTDDAAGTRPARLLLKRTTGRFAPAGEREARFYAEVAPALAPLPVAACYGAAAVDNERWILLEDLSPSHAPPDAPWPHPPSPATCGQAVDALATVHARGWGRADDLGAAPLDEWVERARGGFEVFVEHAALDDDARAVYRAVLDRLPERLGARLCAGPTTLLHGDAHFWNLLYPRTPEDGDARVIDWQLWRVGPAGFDLAYMLALHGEPDWRARHEDALLSRYAARLVEAGIEHAWPALLADYRLGLAYALLYPVLLASMGVSGAIWRPHVRRGLAAYADLGCAAALTRRS